MQIIALFHGNRIPRISVVQRWYLATKEGGTGNFCINGTKSVEELHRFLGMVQYYRDIWARQSKMLAPLSILVGECRHTKVTKKNKTKKLLWQWDAIHQQAFDNVKATITKEVTLAYPDYKPTTTVLSYS